MKKLREEIELTIYDFTLHGMTATRQSKRIIALIDKHLSDSIKDIEWVGECVCDKGNVYFEMPKTKKEYEICPKCNGTGKVTRPATIEEVLREVKTRIRIVGDINNPKKTHHNIAHRAYVAELSLTVNKGILSVK